MPLPYSQITNTLYLREIGMIVTTYTGYFDILENSSGDEFHSIWSNKSEMSEYRGRGSMSFTHLDYSEKLGL